MGGRTIQEKINNTKNLTMIEVVSIHHQGMRGKAKTVLNIRIMAEIFHKDQTTGVRQVIKAFIQ
jgi:hypothetical protein